MAVSKHKLRANGHRGGSGYTKARLRSLSCTAPARGFYGLRSGVASWAYTWVGLYTGRQLFNTCWYGLGKGWRNVSLSLGAPSRSSGGKVSAIVPGRPYEHLVVGKCPGWLNRMPTAKALLNEWAGPEPLSLAVGRAWETSEAWSRWFLLPQLGWRLPISSPSLAFNVQWGGGFPVRAFLGVSGVAYTQLLSLGLRKKGARVWIKKYDKALSVVMKELRKMYNKWTMGSVLHMPTLLIENLFFPGVTRSQVWYSNRIFRFEDFYRLDRPWIRIWNKGLASMSSWSIHGGTGNAVGGMGKWLIEMPGVRTRTMATLGPALALEPVRVGGGRRRARRRRWVELDRRWREPNEGDEIYDEEGLGCLKEGVFVDFNLSDSDSSDSDSSDSDSSDSDSSSSDSSDSDSSSSDSSEDEYPEPWGRFSKGRVCVSKGGVSGRNIRSLGGFGLGFSSWADFWQRWGWGISVDLASLPVGGVAWSYVVSVDTDSPAKMDAWVSFKCRHVRDQGTREEMIQADTKLWYWEPTQETIVDGEVRFGIPALSPHSLGGQFSFIEGRLARRKKRRCHEVLGHLSWRHFNVFDFEHYFPTFWSLRYFYNEIPRGFNKGMLTGSLLAFSRLRS